MIENLAGFTHSQLEFIGTIVISFGASFLLLVWKVARWVARVEYDLDNLGAIMHTEKGLDRAKKKLLKADKADTLEVSMKDFLKSIWANHKKKVLAFIFSLIFAGVAALTGLPVQDVKDAAKDAIGAEAPAEVPAEVPAPAPEEAK